MIPLTEMGLSRWGKGLTADDMKKCVWVICGHSTHFTGYGTGIVSKV
jgi:hypothetical protein